MYMLFLLVMELLHVYVYTYMQKIIKCIFIINALAPFSLYTLYVFQELACIYVEVRASVLISNSIA